MSRLGQTTPKQFFKIPITEQICRRLNVIGRGSRLVRRILLERAINRAITQAEHRANGPRRAALSRLRRRA